MNEALEPAPPTATTWNLPDGREILLRPSRAADAEQVAEAMRTASPRTVRNRFFSQLKQIPIGELAKMLEVDPTNEVCIAAVINEEGVDRIIGGVRFVRIDPPEKAEVAITIHDDFQKRGLGTHLMNLIHPLARERGIRTFTAEVLDENPEMKKLLKRCGSLRISRAGPGVEHIEWEVENTS